MARRSLELASPGDSLLVIPGITPEQAIGARQAINRACRGGLIDRGEIDPILLALGIHAASRPPRGRHTKTPSECTGYSPG
jgi:hypothetical protein